MSNEITDRMNLVKTTLAAALPARIVTRDLLDFSQRADADLLAGVYTLVSRGESGYQNLLGRLAMDGEQDILLVGQIRLSEDALPSAIEDAELDMVAEIKGFVRTLPNTLVRLQMTAFKQSQQMDAPYGWVSIPLKYIR